ncbi:MAG: GNAT family N-acetyltransferase [Candidatus Kapabacteria bacterium]|nr:GNAT family N-acetyltransferase [Candidatus Kapabacteria bacterium]
MNSEISVRFLDEGGLAAFQSVLRIFEHVFEWEDFTMPSGDYLLAQLRQQHFHVLVAELDGNVTGALTAFTLQMYSSQQPTVYIYDLGVMPDYQRRGIGRALMVELRRYAARIGAADVYVQADREDAHALEFYRSAGGYATDVVHFTFAPAP